MAKKKTATKAAKDAARALGRRGGLKGGAARAASLTPERRSEIARAAVRKRWGTPGVGGADLHVEAPLTREASDTRPRPFTEDEWIACVRAIDALPASVASWSCSRQDARRLVATFLRMDRERADLERKISFLSEALETRGVDPEKACAQLEARDAELAKETIRKLSAT